MVFNWLKNLSRKSANKSPCQQRLAAKRNQTRLGLERLEDRTTPATFTPGSVLAADANAPYSLMNVTGGGNFASVAPLATLTNGSIGQIAWSPDSSTAYVSEFSQNSVVAISATGVVSPFATGINNPTGLLLTSNQHLLVASYNTGNVYDITAGGDFT